VPEKDGKMSIFWQQQEEMTQLKASQENHILAVKT